MAFPAYLAGHLVAVPGPGAAGSLCRSVTGQRIPLSGAVPRNGDRP